MLLILTRQEVDEMLKLVSNKHDNIVGNGDKSQKKCNWSNKNALISWKVRVVF